MKHTFVVFLLVLTFSLKSQISPLDNKNGFVISKQLPVTAVKQQYKTNTCWDFTTIAFLESELLRIGKGEYNLSEMWIVRNAYIEKAERFLRLHGHMSFTGGGTLSDPLEIIKKYGLMPDSIYSGLVNGNINHNHFEMDELLKSYMESMVKSNNTDVNPSWRDGYIGILDAYMGKPPVDFVFRGKKYFPQSFAQTLNIDFNDYILITSFEYKPYYQKVLVEVPDNWMASQAYNIKLDDICSLIDYSIENGYTLCWAGDITEKGYKWADGVAYTEKADKKNITAAIRQEAFDNYSTLDDHAMQVIGIAKDKDEEKMYLMKNSWGANDNSLNGFMMVSEDYVKYKTITLLVNKKGLPEGLKKNLGM